MYKNDLKNILKLTKITMKQPKDYMRLTSKHQMCSQNKKAKGQLTKMNKIVQYLGGLTFDLVIIVGVDECKNIFTASR